MEQKNNKQGQALLDEKAKTMTFIIDSKIHDNYVYVVGMNEREETGKWVKYYGENAEDGEKEYEGEEYEAGEVEEDGWKCVAIDEANTRLLAKELVARPNFYFNIFKFKSLGLKVMKGSKKVISTVVNVFKE